MAALSNTGKKVPQTGQATVFWVAEDRIEETDDCRGADGICRGGCGGGACGGEACENVACGVVTAACGGKAGGETARCLEIARRNSAACKSSRFSTPSQPLVALGEMAGGSFLGASGSSSEATVALRFEATGAAGEVDSG
jgi:hypothetical protein